MARAKQFHGIGAKHNTNIQIFKRAGLPVEYGHRFKGCSDFVIIDFLHSCVPNVSEVDKEKIEFAISLLRARHHRLESKRLEALEIKELRKKK